MKEVKILGIDLAKTIFHLHGQDKHGNQVLRKKLKRKDLCAYIRQLKPCLIAMEACSGAHYWGRQFKSMGHEVRLIPPQYVKPYVKTNKNDFVDAEAITEAAGRPHMRCVSLKGVEHHDMQMLHRVRQRVVRERVRLSNEIRGLLQEYGIVIAKGFSVLRKSLPLILEDADNELTMRSRKMFYELNEAFKELDQKIKDYDQEIKEISCTNEMCQRLESIAGIGPVISTALVAATPEPKMYKKGRGYSAWLGLVPKHSGTGGRNRIGGISKRGDAYIRMLLIHGARSALRSRSADQRVRWARKLQDAKGTNKAAVALANKMARVCWVLLSGKAESLKDVKKAA